MIMKCHSKNGMRRFLNEIYIVINVISMSSDDTYQPGAAGVYMYIEIQPDIIVRADIYK
jgi:hypothetical protein